MLIERPVHPAVRSLLMSGNPFQYAHLIKFERPSRPDAITGVVSKSAWKYTYLTDGSIDIPFDDLSVDHLGNSNGTQTYIANKLLSVSNVQEVTEAKANNFTITLDGNGVGAAVTASGVNITSAGTDLWDITWPATVDPISAGFREGDKVLITGPNTGSFNILNFRANNVVRVKKIEDNLVTGTGSVTMSLSSEEIKSILMDKNDSNYASFINREVFIYRAYFQDGQMVGSTPSGGITGPILLFKGIISNVSFDDSEENVKVQWGLTSHWGDFSQVRGRVTSDEFHRALDANGIPQPLSAIKPSYAYDKGFQHAETSVNLLSTYTVKVEKQKVKAKSGFLGLGIGAKVKVKKYYVDEPRYANLDFQLQAKSIPLIYGVRNTEGTVVFADTLSTSSNVVYVVYALGEGQMGGLYDVYVDGKSLICNNIADSNARSQQTPEGTVDVLCSGRADRGDVLGGVASIGGSTSQYYAPDYNQSDTWQVVGGTGWLGRAFRNYYQNYIEAPVNPGGAVSTATNGNGVQHGESIKITYPIATTFDFFSGTEGQVAAPQLVTVASTNGFKLQQSLWSQQANAGEYWGPNHRLADTAYVVAKYTIKEGDSSIPDIEFVVKGKTIDCYNYDYSYSHDDKVAGESSNNFNLGDSVTLYNSGTGTSIGTATIIDKWTIIRPDGTQDYRFKFDTRPNLNYDSNDVPAITRFYMQNGSGQQWTMTTFNYVLNSGTVPAKIATTISSLTNNSGASVVNYPSSTTIPVGGFVDPSPAYSIYGSNGATRGGILVGTAGSTSLSSIYSYKMAITELI